VGGRLALALRVVFYVAVATWLLFLFAFQPYDAAQLRRVLLVSAACLVPLLAAVLYAWPRLSWLRRAYLVAANLCALLLAAELSARAAAWLRPGPLFVRPASKAEARIEQYRGLPGENYFGVPLDARGYHDGPWQPAPGQPRIVAVGDSFSQGVVAHPFHYTTVAERLLGGIPIDNVGVSAIGPSEYLYLIEHEVLPAQPDVIVLALFLGNDVAEADRPPASIGRSWYARENVLLFQLPKRLWALWHEAQPRTRAAGHDFDPPLRVGDPPERFVEWMPWLADPLLESPTFTREAFLEIEKQRLPQIFRADDRSAYRGLFRDLDRIRRATRGIDLRVLLIPTEVQVEPALWDEVVRYAAVVFPLDRDQPQRIVREWLARRGIAYADALPDFRAQAPLPGGRRHLYHLRDTHLNARGNAVLGAVLARLLEAPAPAVRPPADGAPGAPG